MSTVAIENIHTHVARGERIERAVSDSGREVALPLLIAMLCVVAVFLPSFGMEGAARALFLPLSLAVGFSMAASYLLASTMVPILAVWTHRKARSPAPAGAHAAPGFFAHMQAAYGRGLKPFLSWRWIVAIVYLAGTAAAIAVVFPRLGTDIFPKAEAGQLQLRIRAPAGTQLERTEAYTQKILGLIKEETGAGNVTTSLALIGVHGSAYPINFIYLWNSGPQESVLQVELKDGAHIDMDALRERLRKRIAKDMADVEVSFEPADIVSRVMSFGAPTPIEVAVSGPSLDNDRVFAEKVRQKLSASAVAARRSIRPTAGLPVGQRRARPGTGRSPRHYHQRPDAISVAGHLVEPLYAAALLGRSQHRYRIPGPGPGAADTDDIPGRRQGDSYHG